MLIMMVYCDDVDIIWNEIPRFCRILRKRGHTF